MVNISEKDEGSQLEMMIVYFPPQVLSDPLSSFGIFLGLIFQNRVKTFSSNVRLDYPIQQEENMSCSLWISGSEARSGT